MINWCIFCISDYLNGENCVKFKRMATNGIETGAEKPVKVANPASTASVDDKNFRVFLLLIIKKALLINVIYFVGYMSWSVTWLITPMILIETRNFWGKSTAVKREITTASIKRKEKDVILTRVKDLPSWVYFPDFERCEWVNCVSSRAESFVNLFQIHRITTYEWFSFIVDFCTNLANVTRVHEKFDQK